MNVIIPGIKSNKPWCIEFLIVVIYLVVTLHKIFVSISWELEICYFICTFFIWFLTQDNAALIKLGKKFSFLFYFMEDIIQNQFYLFFKCLLQFCLEKEMATHFRILAWNSHGQRRLEGYSLQSMGSQRARHGLATE